MVWDTIQDEIYHAMQLELLPAVLATRIAVAIRAERLRRLSMGLNSRPIIVRSLNISCSCDPYDANADMVGSYFFS